MVISSGHPAIIGCDKLGNPFVTPQIYALGKQHTFQGVLSCLLNAASVYPCRKSLLTTILLLLLRLERGSSQDFSSQILAASFWADRHYASSSTMRAWCWLLRGRGIECLLVAWSNSDLI